jgi:hypothetical protein
MFQSMSLSWLLFNEPGLYAPGNLSAPRKKSALLTALKQEIHRRGFSDFLNEPPSIAQGGKGVVVTGCPACKKRINTMPQFLDHLTDNVLPVLLDKLSSGG